MVGAEEQGALSVNLRRAQQRKASDAGDAWVKPETPIIEWLAQVFRQVIKSSVIISGFQAGGHVLSLEAL